MFFRFFGIRGYHNIAMEIVMALVAFTMAIFYLYDDEQIAGAIARLDNVHLLHLAGGIAVFFALCTHAAEN